MIGITGANGHLGTTIIKLLVQKIPQGEIVAFIRNLDKGSELQSLGVQIRQADYDDQQSFVRGLQGIDTLVLISAHEVGRRFMQHKHVIDAAKETGVKRLIYTSFVHAKIPDWILLLEHHQTEEYIKEIGLNYVICRNSLYAEGMINDMTRIMNEGVYYTSATNGFAYVGIPDLARTYAEVLAHPEKVQSNQIYNFTGPELVTPEDYFNVIQNQTDKKLIYKPVSEEEMTSYLHSIGVPEEAMDGWLGFERMQSEGICSVISNDIEQITGKKPLSLAELVQQPK